MNASAAVMMGCLSPLPSRTVGLEDVLEVPWCDEEEAEVEKICEDVRRRNSPRA